MFEWFKKRKPAEKTGSNCEKTEKVIAVTKIERKYEGNDHIRVEFHLDNGEKQEILWYLISREFETYLCDDRCDTAITALLLAAMKFGYDVIRSDYPISEKLYYNLMYHVVPQLYAASEHRISRIRIEAPVTRETFRGKVVATGMSRGVDSFATMYEYGKNFPMEDYRVNTFTYFQAGAHHGWDSTMGRGEESKQELYQHQMEKTKEFCQKYGYPLIVIDSNIDWILQDSKMFKEWSFDRTHTFRNLSMVMLLQKGICRYYYSSTYLLTEFKMTLNADMAYYEKWLIPHLSTGSVEFYQSNQDWTRMEKVEKLTHLEECYDYLQVCLIKTGNCGKCLKCRRTLMELDALGDDALNKFKNVFDIETYKREDRGRWFRSIVEDKEKANSEAHYFDETFVCAAKNHPELLGELIRKKQEGIRSVRLRGNGVNVRGLPSVRSEILFAGKDSDRFAYLGECGSWYAIRTPDGRRAFVTKRFSELSADPV